MFYIFNYLNHFFSWKHYVMNFFFWNCTQNFLIIMSILSSIYMDSPCLFFLWLGTILFYKELALGLTYSFYYFVVFITHDFLCLIWLLIFICFPKDLFQIFWFSEFTEIISEIKHMIIYCKCLENIIKSFVLLLEDGNLEI